MVSGKSVEDRRSIIGRILTETVEAHRRFMTVPLDPLLAAVKAIRQTLSRGGKILVFGNGGSAADAQHLAGELVGRFVRERRALSAMALSTDTSVLTSVANDHGYSRVFARQVEALGREGDVAFGISTSGNSENVRVGLETARMQGLTSVGLTGGDGGLVGREVKIHINVPDVVVPRIQEVHRTVIHIICELIECDMPVESL
jgi:D-sedoheptulose 7-phosphate isomerase